MLNSEVQAAVNKPLEQLFAYLADLSHHPEWATHKLTLRQTSPGPIGLNTTFNSVGVQLLIPLEDRVEASEYVPNESFAYESYGVLESDTGSSSWASEDRRCSHAPRMG